MKAKSVKKILAVMLAACMVFAAAGCGGGKEPEPAADQPSAPAPDTSESEEVAEPAEDETQDAASASDVKLKFTWWGADTRHEATQKAAELYTQNTGVGFDIEYMAWDGYWQKMTVLAASNSMPDVLQMDAAYIDTYVENNQLADLSEYIDLSTIMPENLIENYKIDGKLYGIPLGANGCGMAYSKTDLAKYGIEEPKQGWTWDEMIEWAKEAAAKCPDGVYPMPDLRPLQDFYQLYVQEYGGAKVLDGKEFNFDEEKYIEYCKMFDSFVEEGICPSAEESLSFVELDPVNDSFTSRKVLLRQINVGNVASLADMMPDDEIGVVNFPQGTAGGGWCQSTMFFSVGANSEHIKEAAEFIYWFVSDVEAGRLLQTVRGLPVSDAVYEAIEADLSPSQQLGMAMYQAINNDKVKGLPFWASVPSDYTSWASEFKSTNESLMLGEMSVDDACAYLKEQGEQVAASLQ